MSFVDRHSRLWSRHRVTLRLWTPLLATFFFVVFLTSPHSVAFDLFPEFQTLTENEALLLDPVNRIDSEYQSDFITFITPLGWDPLFFSAPTGAFDFTLGSLSGEIFMERQRLRLERRLLDGLDFRFTYFRRRDLDDDRTHAVVEMVKSLGSGLAISLYGEPSHFKRENDFGIALLAQLESGWNLRIFHTWVDVTRGSHNDRDDRFTLGAEPRSMGVVTRRYDSTGRWAEAFVRWETPTEWEFPSRGVKYEYSRWSLGGSVRERLGNQTQFLNLRSQVSRKMESIRSLPDRTPTEDLGALDRHLIEVLASITHPLTTGASSGDHHLRPIEIEPGIGWFTREWQGDAGQWLRHRNLSPFVWLRYNGAQLGYEVTVFTSEGTEPLKQPQLKAWKAEHRGNFRYAFSFENGAELSFALTGDLDALVGSESGFFEGGNGMFRTTF